jgi:hypothetical protein
LNSIDNKRRLAHGDHGEDSPVRCPICRKPIDPGDVVFKRESDEALFEPCHPMCEFTTCSGMTPPSSRRAELEQQLMAAEFECRYAMDDDRDSAADWRDSLRRQLDELKPVEDE